MNLQVIDLANPLWLQTLQKLPHDIYHLPEYLALESKRTKTTPEAVLIVDNEKIFFLPYLLRECNEVFDVELTQKFFDVTSPYGYPGILLSEAANTVEFIELALNELTQALSDRQVCSAFLRLHPVINEQFNEIYKSDSCKNNGETVSVDLRLSEAQIWHDTRPEHRTKINKCKRNGLSARIVSFKEYLNAFVEIYEETMGRVKALSSYYFGYDYFLQLGDALGEKLHLCIVESAQQVVCAGLFTECCGMIQYHLGGTKNEFLRQAPSKLMFDYVRLWAKERGNEVLHLGGGVGGVKDSLYHFKAGFSKQRHNFLTLRLITDEKRYFHLVDLRAKSLNADAEKLLKSDFFPAYRSPN